MEERNKGTLGVDSGFRHIASLIIARPFPLLSSLLLSSLFLSASVSVVHVPILPAAPSLQEPFAAGCGGHGERPRPCHHRWPGGRRTGDDAVAWLFGQEQTRGRVPHGNSDATRLLKMPLFHKILSLGSRQISLQHLQHIRTIWSCKDVRESTRGGISHQNSAVTRPLNGWVVEQLCLGQSCSCNQNPGEFCMIVWGSRYRQERRIDKR